MARREIGSTTGPGMTIRRYKTGEEEELWQLRRDTMRHINGLDYTREQIARWAPEHAADGWVEELRRKNPFVVDHEGVLVGFAELEGNGHIDGFYCHFQWQRRGIGTLLYRAIEEEAARLKLDELFLESSVTARGFFLSKGFAIVTEERNLICGAPAPRFHMRKKLG